MRSRRKQPRDLDYGFSNPDDPSPSFEQPADIEGHPIRIGDLRRAGEIQSGRTAARLAVMIRLREMIIQLVGRNYEAEFALDLMREVISQRKLAKQLNWDPSTTNRRILTWLEKKLREKLDSQPKLKAGLDDTLEQLHELD